MGRKYVHQTAQFGKLEIIASCMIFQIDPIRQFCTKHVPMTQYAIMISTSPTPSCGGPLRVQIYWKVCLCEQKMRFCPTRTLFDPLKGGVKSEFATWLKSHNIISDVRNKMIGWEDCLQSYYITLSHRRQKLLSRYLFGRPKLRVSTNHQLDNLAFIKIWPC